jgi:hypothetical protein
MSTCVHCAAEFEQPVHTYKGRPRLYCTAVCARTFKVNRDCTSKRERYRKLRLAGVPAMTAKGACTSYKRMSAVLRELRRTDVPLDAASRVLKASGVESGEPVLDSPASSDT